MYNIKAIACGNGALLIKKFNATIAFNAAWRMPTLSLRQRTQIL
ncbi:hypothetical protein SPONN_1305 [uncultured Candidatus Thioglobus sp.]|nr:hypothetical protein SPONN_1305 [uncultured Candidatus Thioglobus sp.]